MSQKNLQLLDHQRNDPAKPPARANQHPQQSINRTTQTPRPTKHRRPQDQEEKEDQEKKKREKSHQRRVSRKVIQKEKAKKNKTERVGSERVIFPSPPSLLHLLRPSSFCLVSESTSQLPCEKSLQPLAGKTAHLKPKEHESQTQTRKRRKQTRRRKEEEKVDEKVTRGLEDGAC